ncbi:MAG: hypothetical protein OHK0046_20480 [Anaerolineae bacterium]
MPDKLVWLYEQLETTRKRRDRLAVYLMLYGGSLLLMLSFVRRLFRVGGAYLYIGGLTIGVAVMGLVGLWLLVAFVKNRKAILELREDIEIIKSEKPKRAPRDKQRPYYVIGDDGELIPMEAQADEYQNGHDASHQTSKGRNK